jgi:hypothetical protein
LVALPIKNQSSTENWNGRLGDKKQGHMIFDLDFGSVWREGRLMNLQFVSKCNSVQFEREEQEMGSSILETLKISLPYFVKL